MSEGATVAEDTYVERVVAFIDILGFADLVRRADANPTLRNQIAGAARQ